ncbi:Hypothetical predicted protein [Cloeon dipterum]|uniref:Uncharacterized protein n=1 Tax=Cloeon dipterum TaxID=197152 RepID=A0A8S1DY44_9INSE|nr:Hypothetical predicted protein [Cloeon dipterum]
MMRYSTRLYHAPNLERLFYKEPTLEKEQNMKSGLEFMEFYIVMWVEKNKISQNQLPSFLWMKIQQSPLSPISRLLSNISTRRIHGTAFNKKCTPFPLIPRKGKKLCGCAHFLIDNFGKLRCTILLLTKIRPLSRSATTTPLHATARIEIIVSKVSLHLF